MFQHESIRFRDLFSTAWKRTISRHSLWIFGVLAGMLSTGGLCESAGKVLSHIMHSDALFEELYTNPFWGYAYVHTFIEHMKTVNPVQMAVVLSVGSLLFVGLLSASFLSQGALLAGLGKHEASFKTCFRTATRALPRLVLLSLFLHALVWILVLGISIPLATAAVFGTPGAIIFYVIGMLVFFPLAMVLFSAGQLAAIDIVRHNRPFHRALAEASRSTTRHWLVLLEVSICSFLIVCAAAVGFLLLVAVLMIPGTVLILLAIASASSAFLLAVQVIGGLTLLALFLAFFGATTTFQYAVWIELFEHLHVAKPLLLSKTERLWQKLWR